MPSEDQVAVTAAVTYLDEARAMVAELAAAVAPGAELREPVPDGLPLPCSSPLDGLVYYAIARDLDAPEGTGAALVPELAERLRDRGYATTQSETDPTWTSVRAATEYVGVAVLGSPDGPLLRIMIDTRCGRP